MAILFDEKEDWTFQKIDDAYEEIEKIALSDLKLKVFPNQIEIIDSEKMLDAYSTNAMPIYYRHWSLGKSFISNQKSYQGGYQNLAYEVVINSNPVISYLQESNDMTMQALVIAHAAFGHNAVFKNNAEFQKWTSPESILDELNFAKVYIARCEERYGEAQVEAVLDACHALMDYGVDLHKRTNKTRYETSASYQESKKFDDRLANYDLIWEKTVVGKKEDMPSAVPNDGRLEDPEENILYFIEKNAPSMPQWKREIIRIVRKVAQYFHPQGLTKVLNEGAATFTHHYIMNEMYHKGLITDGAWFNFIQSHTNVIAQPEFDDQRYSGLNPYALGFSIFRDMRRICEQPTAEDKAWFPELAGRDWIEVFQSGFSDYNDSGFIAQFLSPKLIRDFKLFTLSDPEKESEYKVAAIHDENGYQHVRSMLAEKYTRSARVPSIKVTKANLAGDRKLTLTYFPYRGRSLDMDNAKLVLEYAKALWGYEVELN